MNSKFMGLMNNVLVIKGLIVALIIIITTLVILRQFNIKSIFNKKGVASSIDHIRLMHKRDKNIIAANRALKVLSAIARIPMFAYDEATREYMQYNIKRAGIRGPGGFKELTADEFKGICVVGTFAVDLVFMSLIIFGLTPIAVIGTISATFAGATLPKMFIRSSVAVKDIELKEGFPDFYMMMHYVLITGANTPIDRIMKSYAKVTDSKEVLRFIDISVDYIETYGEYTAMRYIMRDYREIDVVNKFCRLVKQMLDGGDVTSELSGFRDELIMAKKWSIEKKGDKIIAKAKASFGILYVLLIQAVVSAMLIYLPDIMGAGSIFGM